MILYRIAKSKYASDISSYGAAIHPGRWNKRGTPVLYTGLTPEIALLETLVQIPAMLSPQLDLLTIEIPENCCLIYQASDLPKNWSTYPAPIKLSDIGQNWVSEQRYLGMEVPSSIIHSARNVILNCRHPRYNEVRIIDQKPFEIDKRLIKTI